MLTGCWQVFGIFNKINCRAIFVLFKLFFNVPFIFWVAHHIIRDNETVESQNQQKNPATRSSWFFWKEKKWWFVSKVRINIIQITFMHFKINWSWCMILRILFWKMSFSVFTHWSEQPLAENKNFCWRPLKAKDRETVLKRELYQSLTFIFLKVSSW